MSTASRQAVLAIGLAGLLIESVVSHPALAIDKVVLFKIATLQDEIIVGLTKDQLAQMPGKSAEAVAQALHDRGKLVVWQYGARRGASGDIEQVPLKKISLDDNAAVHVARYQTKSRIVAITEETMADVVSTGAL